MIKAVVIGAGGYSGAELVGLLLQHPRAKVVGLFASARRAAAGAGEAAPTRFDSIFPRFRKRTDLEVRATDVNAVAALGPDVVFLATPHEVSHELAPQLLRHAKVVIDLSAAFRLKDPALYPKHYGFEHQQRALLERAVYGLPELFRGRIREADLIAAPGCYPTSAILPLAPLARASALDPARRVIVDSTSGVSGAGRSPEVKSLFCEVSLQPYNVFKHRHNPEIDAYAGAPVVFTPHLGAYDRGILSTIHAELRESWDAHRVFTTLQGAYANEPFVRLLPSGEWPSVGGVRGTNSCDIGWAVDGQGHLIIASSLDNLVKGAAGQAVQCMNIRFGIPETTSLILEGA